MITEIWKPVFGRETEYEVSDLGRVRSLNRETQQAAKSGTVYTKMLKGRLLKPGLASNGYYTVALGRGCSRTVHSLVAEAFIGPCPDGHEVLHADGTRTNNRLDNLRYGTRTENIIDAIENGTWFSDARVRHLTSGKWQGARW